MVNKRNIPVRFCFLFVFIMVIFSGCKKDSEENPAVPQANFIVSPEQGNTSTDFSFDASSSKSFCSPSDLLYRWDFDDDGIFETQFESECTVFFKFETEGEYSVKLEVKDILNRLDDKIRTVIVTQENLSPEAEFSVSPAAGPVSTVFHFDAFECHDPEDPADSLKVRWDWENDGNWDTEFSFEKITTHKYSTEGNFDIKLLVVDTKGLTAQVVHSVIVDNGYQPPPEP